MTLGRAEAVPLKKARDLAKAHTLTLAEGRDPTAEAATAEANTFERLAAEFIEKHAKPRKKSWANDQRILNRHLLPHWRGRPASALTRRDVRDRLDAIAATAPIQANRVRALCSKIFAFALARDWVTANPVTGLPALTRERSRTRVLTADELRTFWRALDAQELDGLLDAAHADQLRLRLLLGQRAGEIAGMRWADLADGLWTQPDPKNGRVHVLPVTSAFAAVLTRRRASVPAACPWVFPNVDGTGPDIHRAWRAVERPRADRTGTTRGLEAFGIPDAKGHDLRRACATHLARIGVAPHVIGRLLNHAGAVGTVTGIYNRHAYLPELRTALDLWAREVARIASDQPEASGRVVPIGRA